MPNREFLYERLYDLKGRNARRKELEAAGWTVKTFGSNKGGWTVQAYRGEAPYMTSASIGVYRDLADSAMRPGSVRVDSGWIVTPVYRGPDGNEYIDGSPERRYE